MIKIIAAIFLPPLGIYLQSGFGKRLFLNIALTMFGIVPGVIHAIWCLPEKKRGFGLDNLMRRS